MYVLSSKPVQVFKACKLPWFLRFSPPFFSGPAPHHARLAGCIFVQNVEAPALAVTIPVLTRGLNDKNEEVKRTCCQPLGLVCWCQVVPHIGADGVDWMVENGASSWRFWTEKNIRVMEQHI